MDDFGIAPLLDVIKVVKQLLNSSTSIEPHFAKWRQMIQDVESEAGEDDEQQHFDFPQVILQGREVEEDRDKRREKERKKNEKQDRKERKKKKKEERMERKKKQKEDDKIKEKEQKQLSKDAERAKREGLTAALAFMHSRGVYKHSLRSSLVLTKH